MTTRLALAPTSSRVPLSPWVVVHHSLTTPAEWPSPMGVLQEQSGTVSCPVKSCKYCGRLAGFLARRVAPARPNNSGNARNLKTPTLPLCHDMLKRFLVSEGGPSNGLSQQTLRPAGPRKYFWMFRKWCPQEMVGRYTMGHALSLIKPNTSAQPGLHGISASRKSIFPASTDRMENKFPTYEATPGAGLSRLSHDQFPLQEP